jgi:peptidoglycan/xylan/chitin deacetylase (PgdA/CDA1 family)
VDKVAITVDYEFDWGGRVQTTCGIEKMTDKVLEILDANNAKATFFISTETVEKTKKHILDIYNAGHEIASHGHNHSLQYDLLSKDKLEYEIKTSKEILEDLTLDKIYGFRTPQFRKNKYTEELLLKHNYEYDSSSVDTNFLDRYKKNQFQDGKLQNFTVSSIYNKIPAGLKWINLVANNIKQGNQINIIYLHLFDLLSMKDILNLYDKKIISKVVLLFYLARTKNLLKTLESNCINSISLKSNL